MNSVAKRRLNRFFNRQTGLGILLPMDHGLTCGPLNGIERISRMASLLRHPEISGVIAHKGVVAKLDDMQALDRMPLVLHLNGMSNLSDAANTKELVTRMETASFYGVDAVSIQINFDGANDSHNLKMLGQVKDEALLLNLPVLTMLYDKVVCQTEAAQTLRLRQLLRTCIELGSDMIKIGLPESNEGIQDLLVDLCEDARILVAGGSFVSEDALVARLEIAADAGARGFCIGRNIFERKNPGTFLKRLAEIGSRKPAVQRILAELAN